MSIILSYNRESTSLAFLMFLSAGYSFRSQIFINHLCGTSDYIGDRVVTKTSNISD